MSKLKKKKMCVGVVVCVGYWKAAGILIIRDIELPEVLRPGIGKNLQ